VIGSFELFVQPSFELWSSWSLLPDHPALIFHF
jgi:hypothetical protein